MCEANAYILHDDGTEELFLGAVDLIEPNENGGLKLVSIFGEQKIIDGSIERMSLVNHKVLLKTRNREQ